MECPICGHSSGEEFRAKYTLAAKCGNPRCGHIYAKHPEEAQGVQEHSDPEADYQAYRKRNENLIRFWRKTGFLTEQAGLLDIGAGGGHVLRSIREKMPGVAITCIEADPQSAEYLSRMGFDVVNGLDDARGQYDAILLIEVIEHVNEPVPFLAACKKLLAPRGRIFLTTPCGETRSGSRVTNAYDTSEHVQFFTERSLRLCCEKAGLPHLRLRTINELYPPRGGIETALRGLARVIRSVVTGRRHLTGFAW